MFFKIETISTINRVNEIIKHVSNHTVAGYGISKMTLANMLI